jgi:hypothetical protein
VWLAGAGSAALYCIAATPTGVRRCIPLCFAGALLLGRLYDWLRLQRGSVRLAAWAPGLAIGVVLLLGGETLSTARGYRDRSLILPHDFDWIAPDMKLLLGEEDLGPQMREQVVALAQPIRAMCLLNLLGQQPRPDSSPVFQADEIRAFYFQSDPERYK